MRLKLIVIIIVINICLLFTLKATAGKKELIHDPEVNFQDLWDMFNEHYAFFKLWNVDWKKQYEIYRPMVNKDTSDDGLFEIMCNMIRPLKDGHINLEISGKSKKKFNPEEEARFLIQFNNKKLINRLFQTIEITLESKGFNKLKSATDLFQYSASKEFGYLRILEFEGEGKNKIIAAIDGIIKEFQGLKGVIIDIRENPGGTDKIVYIIANRFTDKKRVGHHYKTKKGTEEDNFGPLKTGYLVPEGPLQFTGPIILLTSDASFSGADVFAMVMRELPHVTIMGDHTSGQFSNMLEKKLPNGWKYTLSHQRYYSSDMICYEGKGISPDIKALNSIKDIENKEDSVIIKALQIWESGRK